MLRTFKRKALATTATVTHVETRRGVKGNAYYVLTLEYRTIDTAQLFTRHAISAKKYAPGSILPLMYLPDDPAKFSIGSGKGFPYMIAFSMVLLLLIVWFCAWLNGLEYTVR